MLYYPKEKEVVVYSTSIPAKNPKDSLYSELTRYDYETGKVLFSATIVRDENVYFYMNDAFQFYPEEE